MSVVAPEAVSAGATVDYVRALDNGEWSALDHRIELDSCLPVLGPRADVGLPSRDADLANAIAAKYGLAGADVDGLSSVVQRLSDARDSAHAKQEVAKVLAGTPSPDLADPDEIHAVLAELPLSFYVTTAYDSHMEEALRRRKRTPFQETWSTTSGTWASVSAASEAPQPSPSVPWVVHLRGVLDRPDSLILTEAEHIRFFGAVLHDSRFLALEIQRALVSRVLLYLGHRMEDRITQLLLESFSPLSNRNRLRVSRIVPEPATPSATPCRSISSPKELRARWLARTG